MTSHSMLNLVAMPAKNSLAKHTQRPPLTKHSNDLTLAIRTKHSHRHRHASAQVRSRVDDEQKLKPYGCTWTIVRAHSPPIAWRICAVRKCVGMISKEQSNLLILFVFGIA